MHNYTGRHPKKATSPNGIDIVKAFSKKGYRIIPLGANSKKSCISEWPRKASADPEIMRTWARQFPRCNWGVLAEGLFVVDIDKRDDGDGFEHVDKIAEAAGHAWEEAPIITTPSGGEHRYFRLSDDQQKDERIRSGSNVLGERSRVDVKTGRAYLVVPPSTIDGNAYSGDLPPREGLPLAPDAMIDLLFGGAKENGRPLPGHSDAAPLSPPSPPEKLSQHAKQRWLVLHACKRLRLLKPEDFDDWFLVLKALASDVVDRKLQEGEAWEIFDTWSKTARDGRGCPNYNYENNHRKFHECLANTSSRATRETFGSIYHRLSDYLEHDITEGKAVDTLRDLFGSALIPKGLALAAVSKDWVFVRQDADIRPYRHLGNGKDYSRRGFMDFLAPLKVQGEGGKIVPVARLWSAWNNRREVDDVRFMPGKEAVIEKDGRLILNTFRGLDVDCFPPYPNPEEKALVLLRHIRERLCHQKDDLYQELLRLLAWWVQNPDKPGQRCIAIRGGQGTGKSMFGKIVQNMFSPYSLQTGNATTLTSNFNGHLEHCLFLQADEAFFAGSHDVRRRLKAYITDENIAYESKGRDVRHGKNHLRIIMTTNDEWVVNLDIDDRRYVVLDIAPRQSGDDAYFGELSAAVNDKKTVAALYQFLKAMDLGEWHPMRMKCNTDALIDQKRASLDPLMKCLLDWLEEGELMLRMGSILNWPENAPLEIREYNKTNLIETINSPKYGGNISNTSALTKRLTSLFGHETAKKSGSIRYWSLPSLEVAKHLFTEKTGIPIP